MKLICYPVVREMKKFHSKIPSSAITLSRKKENIKILIAAQIKKKRHFFKNGGEGEEKDEFNV